GDYRKWELPVLKQEAGVQVDILVAVPPTPLRHAPSTMLLRQCSGRVRASGGYYRYSALEVLL
ncbi:MAG: hypothetical protein WCI20_13645, partial [bacterium]